MMGNLFRSAAVALVVAAICGFSAGRSLAADGNTIRYGIDDEQNINRLPQFVAEKKGFFASEGVKVDFVRLKSAFRIGPAQQATENLPTVRQAMTSGSIDMSRQQLPLLIRDDMAGAKFVGVAVAANSPAYLIVAEAGPCYIALSVCEPDQRHLARDNIFQDFKKGDTIAVTNSWDGITIWTQKLFSEHGLAKKDFNWKSIAGSNARVDCLTSQQCRAAVLDPQAIFRAPVHARHIYGSTGEVGPQLYQVDIANPDWAAAHRDLIASYIRATTAAMRFITDPRNRDETANAVMELTKLPQDQSKQMLDFMGNLKSRYQTAAPDMANVKAVIELLGENGALKRPLPSPERFVDSSYARDAHLQNAAAK